MTAWDRLDGESERAYEAFLAYRNQVPERRTARLVWEAGLGAKTTVNEWSSKFAWVARSRAYDDYQRRLEAEAEARTAITVREMDRADYESALNRSLQMQIAAINSLANAELRKLRERQERGEDVEPMALKRLVASIAEADTLARRSAGLPTTYRHGTASGDGDTGGDDGMVYIIGAESNKGDDDVS